MCSSIYAKEICGSENLLLYDVFLSVSAWSAYERERLAGNRKKFISHIDSQQTFRARIRLFRSARGQP
jgi:hypothetical protein